MKKRPSFLLVLLLAVLGRGEGVGRSVATPPSGDVAVTLTQRNVYEVEGGFQVPVPRSVAWAVLTDYEHIGDFVPAVKRSWVAEEKDGEALVGQDLAGGWLFFSCRVVLRLEVREAPPEKIHFKELSEKDFVSYAGGWTLEEIPGGTSVVYRLRAEPKFHVPGFMLRSVLKGGAQDLLRGVQREMIRRNEGNLWDKK